jgi:hypothetical protein
LNDRKLPDLENLRSESITSTPLLVKRRKTIQRYFPPSEISACCCSNPSLFSLGLALGELVRQVRQPNRELPHGLLANSVAHFDLPLVFGVLAVAVTVKFTDRYLGFYLGGKRGRYACPIGFA